MQATGTPRSRTVSASMPKPPEVRDVEHDDDVGPAQLLDRFGRAIDAGQIFEQELESRRGGRRVRDRHVAALGPEQVRESGLAAESVAVGIHMGGETDALARIEDLGQAGGRGAIGVRQCEGHDQRVNGER